MNVDKLRGGLGFPRETLESFRSTQELVVKTESIEEKPEDFHSYRERVRALTEKVAHLIPGIENRA